MTRKPNRYVQLLEHLFNQKYQPGDTTVTFERTELVRVAEELGIPLPLNLGDVVYALKYRKTLPQSMQDKAPPGRKWIIANRGRSQYAFVARGTVRILPDQMLTVTKLPDATPGLVAMYSFNDEQALLTKLRYNRLLDIFTGVTCYSLQNHLRTTVRGIGQVETDEIFVGVDRRGEHFVFPVQAKGGRDELGVVQIEQDIALCAEKFPQLTCRPVAAQFMAADVIALFEFEVADGEVRKVAEKHYKLVPKEQITLEELTQYARRTEI